MYKPGQMLKYMGVTDVEYIRPYEYGVAGEESVVEHPQWGATAVMNRDLSTDL